MTALALAALAVGCSSRPAADGGADASDAAVATDAPRDVAVGEDVTAPDVVETDAGETDAGPSTGGFDPAIEAHIREVVAAGRARGNRVNVVAKIGDSITESRAFLYGCGSGMHDFGEHARLGNTIATFMEVLVDPDFNSLEHPSACAASGWTSEDAIAGGDGSPLVEELTAIRPMWALVMYGTNDLQRSPDATAFATRMSTLLTMIEDRGTVPILSTIPPRTDDAAYTALVTDFNDALRRLATERRIPLMDYWAEMSPLPQQGLSDDGVHPNTYTPDGTYDSCNFTAEGLRYGYNVRNRLALDALSRVLRVAGGP